MNNILEIEKESFNDIKDSPEFAKKLYEINYDFSIRYTHEAVTFEGLNKATLEQVSLVLSNQKVAILSEREIKEIKNHFLAYKEIIALVRTNNLLDEEKIKDIHEIITSGINPGGFYRNVNIQIYGATHQPPDYLKVYDRMKRYFFNLNQYLEDCLDKAIFAHAELAKIHPFFDGNGRLARLVMNYYLIKAGYIPVSIDVSCKDEYIKALEDYKVNKKIDLLKELIIKLLLERYMALNLH